MPEIRVQSADGSTARFPIAKQRLTVGRSRDSDIFLPDQWLSRHHAEIAQRGADYYVLDLGSKNGTLLNGTLVQEPHKLRHGDVITLGEHVLTFSSTAASEPEEEDLEPFGTRVFSAKELSGIDTRPLVETGEDSRQTRLLTVLSEAARELVIHRPLPELFETILNLVFKAVAAERAAILLTEGSPPLPVVKASRSRHGAKVEKISGSIARRVLKDRVSLLLSNLLEDAAFRGQESIMSTGIRSAVCAPLWNASGVIENEVMGLVYADSLRGSHNFTEEDVHILTVLANVAAAKIENVRLLEESLEMRRMEQDMRVAAEIQKGLLPSAVPSVSGYGLAGSNRPCRTVGGDYYDFALEGGRLLLALGDVSGKGTGAALLMAVLRASVRAHWGDLATAEAVSRINRTVCQNVPPNKYITFFLARLDPESGLVHYVNAGHNAPLLMRADGTVETLEEGGMVLGLFESVPYADGSVEMRHGDTLIIYSDGVTETFDDSDREFAEEGLVAVARRERHEDAPAQQDAILRELETFSRGAKATDDRTLIVLKRH